MLCVNFEHGWKGDLHSRGRQWKLDQLLMLNTNGSSRRAILVEMTVLLALLGGSALISLAAPGLDNQPVWRAEQVLINAADQAGLHPPPKMMMTGPLSGSTKSVRSTR